jgi:tetratricopeptide (TPR) repeat protein
MTGQDRSAASRPEGTVFGAYRLHRILGEGASGQVWLAGEESSRREVALKLLRSSRIRSDFQHRFTREIRLLGALEHPNIARLYAAGTVEEQRGPVPYLAMEYVRGGELRDYAEANSLSVDERLRLIATLARAMHYAHTRGVVHRDLKPENIVVDEQGEPRVLDFGVAHVVGSDEATRMTATGEILGTVAYMAPEQLSGGHAGADPRMDVYGLGVVAYELLSGELPFPALSRRSMTAAILAVTSEPPRPLAKVLPSARGDPDTIVMKAIAGDPGQRYASAADLAADIERYLGRQPIAARPPSPAYLAALFVRRHRALTASLAAAALCLIGATLTSTYFAVSESKARQLAEARLSEREAVTEFLQDMLTAADPENALGERLTVRDVLGVARTELDGPGELDPSVAAQLYRTLGNTYSSLGRGEDALESLERAIDLAAESGEQNDPTLALDRAAALAAAGREAEALELTRDLIARLEAREAPPAEVLYDARLREAMLLDQRGHIEQAETILRGLMNARARSSPPDDRGMRLRRTLAMNLHRQGRYEASIELGRAAAEAAGMRYGSRHPLTLEIREIVAVSLRDLARFDEAESIYRSTLALRRDVLGDDHPLTHQTRGGLAAVLAFDGQAEEAWPLVKRGYDGLVDQLGIEAESVRIMGNLYAHVASQRDDYGEAIRVLRILVEQNEAMPGGPSATDLADYNNLAYNLMQSERCDEALPVQRRLLEMAADKLGQAHLHTALFRVNFATCLERGDEPQRAADALDKALPVMRESLGAEHPRTIEASERLAELRGRSP